MLSTDFIIILLIVGIIVILTMKYDIYIVPKNQPLCNKDEPIDKLPKEHFEIDITTLPISNKKISRNPIQEYNIGNIDDFVNFLSYKRC